MLLATSRPRSLAQQRVCLGWVGWGGGSLTVVGGDDRLLEFFFFFFAICWSGDGDSGRGHMLVVG